MLYESKCMCCNCTLTLGECYWKTDTEVTSSATHRSVVKHCCLIPGPSQTQHQLPWALHLLVWEEFCGKACPLCFFPQHSPLSLDSSQLELPYTWFWAQFCPFSCVVLLSYVTHLWPLPCRHIPTQLPWCHPTAFLSLALGIRCNFPAGGYHALTAYLFWCLPFWRHTSVTFPPGNTIHPIIDLKKRQEEGGGIF